MTQKSSSKVDIFVAGKSSVNKALDFVKFKKKNKKRSLDNDGDECNKTVQNCTSCVDLRRSRNLNLMGLSPTFIGLQMRSCIMQQDWINLQRLIPLLLDHSVDREPILWRFALIAFLNSPESHDDNILEFLEKCIGCVTEAESHEPEQYLQQFLTIQEVFESENKRKC